MGKQPVWPAEPLGFITHLHALDTVRRAGAHRKPAEWLLKQCASGGIATAWVWQGNLRPLGKAFWLNPEACKLFDSETVNAAKPFGRQPRHRALTEPTYLYLAHADLEQCLFGASTKTNQNTSVSEEDELRALAREVAKSSKHLRRGIPMQQRLSDDLRKEWIAKHPNQVPLALRRYTEAARSVRSGLPVTTKRARS